MALLQRFHLEHLPPTHSIHIALYRNVKNGSFLHQQLLAGNTEFEYAFIDASVILSKLHALSASFRAVNDLIHNRLRSRNVHSEIVFSLSPNNNIAESFRRFGISPTTSNLLVIKVDMTGRESVGEEVQENLRKVIEGEQVEFEEEVLMEMTDMGRVRKIYKLSATGGGGGGGGERGGQLNRDSGGVFTEENERRELEFLVMGSMALRGAMN